MVLPCRAEPNISGYLLRASTLEADQRWKAWPRRLRPLRCSLAPLRMTADWVVGWKGLFALRLPQLAFCCIDFALRLLAKKNAAELIPLVVSSDELLL